MAIPVRKSVKNHHTSRPGQNFFHPDQSFCLNDNPNRGHNSPCLNELLEINGGTGGQGLDTPVE